MLAVLSSLEDKEKEDVQGSSSEMATPALF